MFYTNIDVLQRFCTSDFDCMLALPQIITYTNCRKNEPCCVMVEFKLNFRSFHIKDFWSETLVGVFFSQNTLLVVLPRLVGKDYQFSWSSILFRKSVLNAFARNILIISLKLLFLCLCDIIISKVGQIT